MLSMINLDDTVDLREAGPKRFFAVKSDGIRFFELDGRRFPWVSDSVPESLLRLLADIPDNYEIWLEQRGREDDLQIPRGGSVDLTGSKLERLYSGAPETTAGWTALLPGGDAEYLAENGYKVDVIQEGGQTSLILRGYDLPPGKYEVDEVDVLVILPAGYPDLPTDMFYCSPWLRLKEATGYPTAADVPHAFHGITWQRWSRHNTEWRPGKDGIRTVLRRVDAALVSA